VSKKLQNIGIVSFLTIVSRVLGLLRDTFSAAVFGLGALQDAFVTAFSLPNLFRRLLGEGALTAAFVPKLQEELQARERPGAFALLSNVASWLAVVTGLLVAVAMLALAVVQKMPLAGGDWPLVAHLSLLLFPYLAFVCVAAVLSAALNVLGRFTEPALSPIWLNFAMIGSLAFAVGRSGASDLARMHWLCAGVLLGGFLQMAVPALALMREGWRPAIDLRRTPAIHDIAALMAPSLFGVAIYQINIYVSRLIAFSLERSAASALFFANRLMELPIGVFAIAVSTVIYPLLAKHAVARDFRAMGEDYRKGLRLIFVINVPAAAGLAVLSEPIVRLLFQRGEFTAGQTAVMAPLLALFALGMPFFSMTTLTVRACYALRDVVTPVKMAAISFVLNLGLTLVLKDVLGARGLVIASTVAIIAQTVLLQRALVRKLPGLAFADLWRSLGKVVAASAVMGGVVALGWRALAGADIGTRATDVAALAGLIPAGVAVYALMLWWLRIEGRAELRAVIAKVGNRLTGRAAKSGA
jgi:putative peptidoglycan lipid II flippase